MTMHLSSQECVTALDKALTPARKDHLDACPSCQAQVAELRTVMVEAAQDAEVPEPSPLFWDHFQSRVLTAVQSEEPARDAWWTHWLDVRTLITIGAVVIAVGASVALYVSRTVVPEPAALTDAATVDSGAVAQLAPLDSDEWEFVTSVMGTLQGDDMHEVLTPSRDAVDTALDGLTSDERDRFIKLLKMSEGLE